eukprot:gene41535-50686_t
MIVKIQNSLSGDYEWGMVELQGDIVGAFLGQKLGTLFIKEDGKVEVEIGNQFVEGSVVTLKQPFLVVGDDAGGSLAEPKLEVKGIIKKKIIFNQRPKPLTMKKLRI